jgi:hypothetical protein
VGIVEREGVGVQWVTVCGWRLTIAVRFMGFLSKKIPKYEEERIAMEAG